MGNQERSLAFWKKAAEQSTEVINAKRPNPIIKEIPATIKSSIHVKLTPITTIIAAYTLLVINDYTYNLFPQQCLEQIGVTLVFLYITVCE